MSSRDAAHSAAVVSGSEQSKAECRSPVRNDVRTIGQATRNLVNGNVDAQARCDASVSDSMHRVSTTRAAIERSRRRLAGHTFYVA
jgi:hypothetical protein